MTNGGLLDVAIVGSGFAGVCMAIRARSAGKRFVVLEKEDRIGGVWRDNRYPGCACDVPSHLYCFSFEPNPRWSRVFAPQPEILAYLERCADKYGIRPHVRTGAAVTGATLDEARGVWHVELGGEEVLEARHLVLGIGGLSRPAIPDLPGLDRFAGRAFHSARWDHDFDLTGKTVAVVGTGASAIQFVPRIVPRVRRLHVFQRTPPWVLPKPDRPITPREQRLFERIPATQRLLRWWIWAAMETFGLGFTMDPRAKGWVRRIGLSHIERSIRDPALRALVTPDYEPGCKRILISDDWYPAIAQPHVEVVRGGACAVTESGIVGDDGAERRVDAIIFGTGFHVTEVPPIRIVGRGGRTLAEAWSDGMEAYRGTTIAGFPNLYVLTGPNTGLGSNSMVFVIEAQVDYVLEQMRRLEAVGARWADVRADVQKEYNERLQARLGKTVWATGCKSWYLDARGRNTTLWPGTTTELWLRTRRVKLSDHELARA